MFVFLIGTILGVVLTIGVIVYLASRIDTEQNVNNAVKLHAVRRRRELDQFRRQTKTDARRLRHELRQELRSIDQHRR